MQASSSARLSGLRFVLFGVLPGLLLLAAVSWGGMFQVAAGRQDQAERVVADDAGCRRFEPASAPALRNASV